MTKPPHGLRRMEQREAKPFLACNMPCLETDCGLGSRNLTVASLLRNDRHMPLAYSKSVKKGVEKTLEEVKRQSRKVFRWKLKYHIARCHRSFTQLKSSSFRMERHYRIRKLRCKENICNGMAPLPFVLVWLYEYGDPCLTTRRDRLVLEKIKVGPPRSINIIRKTFGMGDSRSGRLFSDILYPKDCWTKWCQIAINAKIIVYWKYAYANFKFCNC